jgi:tRNA(Ile)-lysidine synthase
MTQSRIFIAVSGGADSLALALLLKKYGRRIAPQASLEVIHVNHRWRAGESTRDARWVKKWCASRRLPCQVFTAPRPQQAPTEEAAREFRKGIFERLARRSPALILTAHHADDQAETVLWRLMTGGASTHGRGILRTTRSRSGSVTELRPFLEVRRKTLQAFLKEEGEGWLEDPSNQDPRFLRARLRADIMPLLEQVFPKAVEHLCALAKGAPAQEQNPLASLLLSGGFRARRGHFHEVAKRLRTVKALGEVALPDGWRLRVVNSGREKADEKSSKDLKKAKNPYKIRYILEQNC